jgi:glycosyltransferase involved in cell wall biosynthesis
VAKGLFFIDHILKHSYGGGYCRLNSNSKKVSVLLASYNHSDYVLKAINSVLEQNWPNVDLIVIDDGSTDDSPDLLSDFHKKHRGFRLIIHSKNKGVVKTLNEGLRIAEGEFICNLGSDDYLAAGSLAIRASYLCEHPECVAVFGDGYILCDDMITDQ